MHLMTRILQPETWKGLRRARDLIRCRAWKSWMWLAQNQDHSRWRMFANNLIA